MARTRDLKPGFFTNAGIAELQPLTRLFFQGLWVYADREGRLEYRPKSLKIQILPYDNVDINEIMEELSSAKDECGHHYIEVYEVEGQKYIQIVNFTKNQKFHPKETPSVLPENPDCLNENLEQPKVNLGAPQQVSSKPLPSLPSIPSLPSKSSKSSFNSYEKKENISDLNFNDLQVEHGEAVAEFWDAYPNGQNKHNGTKAFLRLLCAGVDPQAMIKGALCLSEWVKAETKSRGKPPLIKHAQNWLEARGWEDELVMPEPQGTTGGTPKAIALGKEMIERFPYVQSSVNPKDILPTESLEVVEANGGYYFKLPDGSFSGVQARLYKGIENKPPTPRPMPSKNVSPDAVNRAIGAFTKQMKSL